MSADAFDRESGMRTLIQKHVRKERLLRWSWWLTDDLTGKTFEGPHRTFTESGAWSQAHKAYLRVIGATRRSRIQRQTAGDGATQIQIGGDA